MVDILLFRVIIDGHERKLKGFSTLAAGVVNLLDSSIAGSDWQGRYIDFFERR